MKLYLLVLLTLINPIFSMELFIKESCPYCHKVRKAIKNHGYVEGNNITIVDANQTENAKRLVQLGGKMQVPFLLDKNVKMYESNDIIKYLKNK